MTPGLQRGARRVDLLPQGIWKKRGEPDEQPPRGGRQDLERKREPAEQARTSRDPPRRTQAIEGPPKARMYVKRIPDPLPLEKRTRDMVSRSDVHASASRSMERALIFLVVYN